MSDQKPHNFFLPVATIFLAMTIFFGNSVQILEAQPAGATPSGEQQSANNPSNSASNSAQSDTSVNNPCQPMIKKLAVDQLKDFRDFLEINFQNKSSTSSLLGGALDKYREIGREMMNAYAKYYPNQGSSQLLAALEPGTCLKIIEDTLADAKVLLKLHAMRTSGVKKSAALLEKYQSINGQLSDMSRQFTNLKSLMDAFSQKLPCYVKKGECLRN